VERDPVGRDAVQRDPVERDPVGQDAVERDAVERETDFRCTPTARQQGKLHRPRAKNEPIFKCSTRWRVFHRFTAWEPGKSQHGARTRTGPAPGPTPDPHRARTERTHPARSAANWL